MSTDTKKDSEAKPEPSAWERERDKLRAFWIVSVLLFWFMVAFQGFMFYLQDGKVNLVLMSIIAGLMILGVAMKIKYQRHLAKK